MNNDLAVAYILVINSKEQSSLTNYEESQDNEEYSNQGFHYQSKCSQAHYNNLPNNMFFVIGSLSRAPTFFLF